MSKGFEDLQMVEHGGGVAAAMAAKVVAIFDNGTMIIVEVKV